MPAKSGKIGIAMIGCGEISTVYVPAIQVQEGAEAIWCADVSESQARRIGEHCGVPWTTDIDMAINDPRVDAVIIAVPHSLHMELTVKAAQAGKHVMCDKPISTNRADALRMIQSCRENGVKLGVNLASRYQPFATATKDLLDRKVIGEPFLIKISAYANKPEQYWKTGWMEGGNTSWRASKQMAGGGIGIMNMTHEIDRVRFCTGLEVVHVSGEYDRFLADVEVEDTFVGLMRYNNGAIGVVVAGSNTYGGRGEPTRIFGTKGQLELWEPVKVFTTREDTEFAPNEWHTLDAARMDNNYIPYIRDFVQAIRNDTLPPITGEDGFRVLDIILGVYDSSDTKSKVAMRAEV